MNLLKGDFYKNIKKIYLKKNKFQTKGLMKKHTLLTQKSIKKIVIKSLYTRELIRYDIIQNNVNLKNINITMLKIIYKQLF